MIGRLVIYHDATGTAKPALIVRVRDKQTEKVKLVAVEEAGSLTAVDNVLRDDRGTASTWRPQQ